MLVFVSVLPVPVSVVMTLVSFIKMLDSLSCIHSGFIPFSIFFIKFSLSLSGMLFSSLVCP